MSEKFIDIERQKIDCLRFVMCLLLVPGFQGFFFLFLIRLLTVLKKQTRQVGCAIKQCILLRCLWSNLTSTRLLERLGSIVEPSPDLPAETNITINSQISVEVGISQIILVKINFKFAQLEEQQWLSGKVRQK